MFASFGGHTKLTNMPFTKTVFANLFFFAHQFWPLRTAFQLNNGTVYSKNQAHATDLTDNAVNLLKLPKTSKCLFEIVQNFQNSKIANLGGYIYIYMDPVLRPPHREIIQKENNPYCSAGTRLVRELVAVSLRRAREHVHNP